MQTWLCNLWDQMQTENKECKKFVKNFVKDCKKFQDRDNKH